VKYAPLFEGLVESGEPYWVANGQNHQWSVRALREPSGGSAEYTSWQYMSFSLADALASLVTLISATPTLDPSGTATPAASVHLTLTWQDHPEADAYQVYVADTQSASLFTNYQLDTNGYNIGWWYEANSICTNGVCTLEVDTKPTGYPPGRWYVQMATAAGYLRSGWGEGQLIPLLTPPTESGGMATFPETSLESGVEISGETGESGICLWDVPCPSGPPTVSAES
jgi:hypothetical protein